MFSFLFATGFTDFVLGGTDFLGALALVAVSSVFLYGLDVNNSAFLFLLPVPFFGGRVGSSRPAMGESETLGKWLDCLCIRQS